ncbi:hypothetical protein [Oscillibacter sp.]|uniref:hypothetical protein n=1 Tax=Oscillibacter sp. TaxID=1945593 RepID=UPI0037C6F2AD
MSATILLLMHRAYEKVRDETETSWLQREPIIADSVKMAALLHAGYPSPTRGGIRLLGFRHGSPFAEGRAIHRQGHQ